MDYQNMKKYKINTEGIHIGDVLFIVEGAETEFDILESIFTKRLEFQLVKKVRNKTGYILRGKNSSKRIYAFNYSKNQLHKMNFKELDTLYGELRNTYGFNPSNASVYLIYDRDVECYEPHNVDIRNEYIRRFSDYRNISDHRNIENIGYDGLLILSFPCIESYLTSCFIENTFMLEHRIKKDINMYNSSMKIKWGDIFRASKNVPKDRLIVAAEEMDKALAYFGINDYDIDNFSETNIRLFDGEEKNYLETGKFRLISLLSIIFMQLGIIEEVTGFDPSEPRRAKQQKLVLGDG